MKDVLLFDPEHFEVRTCEMDGRSVTFRAFEGLAYCASPKDPIQKMNLYAPEGYFAGDTIHGYTLKTAPIFMPNTVAGYMQGPAMTPGIDHFTHRPNTAFEALVHGYVVACAGIRGRNTGMPSREFFVGGSAEERPENQGRLVGKAPALIVDMKAAIRYLRHNADRIPGDPEKIITNGTSAGGALSALAGATGNAKAYEPYLEEIGAAKERDDIFAASCYCPIHNLEHADMAYEWMFCGENEYHTMKFEIENGAMRFIPQVGVLTDKQIALSRELKASFPAYVNGLELKEADGALLTLSADGTGSFAQYVKRQVIRSAQKELDTHDSENRHINVPGSDIDQQDYLVVQDGKVIDLDWDRYVKKITRMKPVPAFDALDMRSPENEEFGTETIPARHFTAFSQIHSEVQGALAEEWLVQLLNPTLFIGKADTAPHWRIRHGAFDRDTALAIPVILSLLLKDRGYDTDFAAPWGVPHSGDYDLNELFAWIDERCR